MALPDMTWSLNEIEALARKAAKGGGYTWGLAEDAGRAVRWLCWQDIDGASALAQHLIEGEGGRLCPIRLGTALADLGIRAEPGPLGEVAHATLLLPFVADIAKAQNRAFTLTCATGLAAVAPNDMVIVQGALTGRLRLTSGGHIGKRQTPQGRARVSPETAAALQGFAAKTYAPSTDQSRSAGAGPAFSDND